MCGRMHEVQSGLGDNKNAPAAPLQEVHHDEVAPEARIVQGRESLHILIIDQILDEFSDRALLGRVPHVGVNEPVLGHFLHVVDDDSHHLELVLVRRDVQHGISFFVSQAAEVDVGVALQILAESLDLANEN